MKRIPMFLLLFLACSCVGVRPIRHAEVKIPIISESFMAGNKQEFESDIVFRTEVIQVKIPLKMLKKFKEQFDIFGKADHFASAEYYEYSHTFINKGSRTVDIGFPEEDISSPILSAMRGFSLRVEPHSQKLIRFISSSKPVVSQSFMFIAICYGRNKWVLSGGSRPTLYKLEDSFAFTDKRYYPDKSLRN